MAFRPCGPQRPLRSSRQKKRSGSPPGAPLRPQARTWGMPRCIQTLAKLCRDKGPRMAASRLVGHKVRQTCKSTQGTGPSSSRDPRLRKRGLRSKSASFWTVGLGVGRRQRSARARGHVVSREIIHSNAVGSMLKRPAASSQETHRNRKSGLRTALFDES